MKSEFIIMIIWMLFGLYVLVFMAILADLWSGVRKAKQRGEARTSYGFRRTIDKMARYFNLLLILTIIDAMQIAGIWYLDVYYAFNIPLVPIVTFIGAMGIGLIELKSIYEKAEDKEYRKITRLAESIFSNKDNPEAISKALVDYLNNKKEEKNENSDN